MDKVSPLAGKQVMVPYNCSYIIFENNSFVGKINKSEPIYAIIIREVNIVKNDYLELMCPKYGVIYAMPCDVTLLSEDKWNL